MNDHIFSMNGRSDQLARLPRIDIQLSDGENSSDDDDDRLLMFPWASFVNSDLLSGLEFFKNAGKLFSLFIFHVTYKQFKVKTKYVKIFIKGVERGHFCQCLYSNL